MVTAFSIIMNNFTLNLIGILHELPGPIVDTHARYSMFPTSECDNWKDLHPAVQEQIPDKSGTPPQKGWPVRMTVFNDVDHKIREAIAVCIMRFTHISSEQNYADILTKPLGPGVFMDLVKPLLFRNPPEE